MQPKTTVRRARRLRKAPTTNEAVLWSHIRDCAVAGLRFRRQVPIGNYVVDFACLSVRLIVEVDGGVHDLRTFDDARRDAWLREQGFQVVRFTNGQVRNRLHEVLSALATYAPSPISGEGGPRSGSDGGSFHSPTGEMATAYHQPPSVRLRLPPSPEMGEG